MGNKPLVSIIIPIYNTEQYLDKCLESIINQSYTNIEILLIDDGSTDNSLQRCKEYDVKDSRVTIIHQENQGLSGARNTGIKKCRGEYITFIDSDDDVERDYIEYLVRLIQPDNNMSICAHKEIKNKKIVKNYGHNKQQKQLNTSQCLMRMLNEDGFMVSAWGKLYKKELFNDIKFPIGVIHEDICTTYKLILKSDKIQYGPEPKYNYYQNSNSITNSKFNDRKMSIVTSTDKMCDVIEREFPDLSDICLGRRIQARFSVLRLILDDKNNSKKRKAEKTQMKRFIFKHRKDALRSKQVPIRTKTAIRILTLGENCFKYSWKIYSKLFK